MFGSGNHAIQLGRETRPDDAHRVKVGGGIVRNGAFQQLGHAGAGVEVAGVGLQALRRAFQAGDQISHSRHRLQDDADLLQVSRRGPSAERAVGQPLKIGQRFEQAAHLGTQEGVAHECLDLIQTRLQRRHIEQRAADALAEQPRAHRRHRLVEHVQQRGAFLPG